MCQIMNFIENDKAKEEMIEHLKIDNKNLQDKLQGNQSKINELKTEISKYENMKLE